MEEKNEMLSTDDEQKLFRDKKWYHNRVTDNKEELSRSKTCGCISCMRIFSPQEIESYLKNDSGETAFCPYCMMDAVIGDATGVKLTKENLKKLNQIWFGTISRLY
jgi:hypothetical protein